MSLRCGKYTKAEILEQAKKLNIKHDTSETKGELCDKIVKYLNKRKNDRILIKRLPEVLHSGFPHIQRDILRLAARRMSNNLKLELEYAIWSKFWLPNTQIEAFRNLKNLKELLDIMSPTTINSDLVIKLPVQYGHSQESIHLPAIILTAFEDGPGLDGVLFGNFPEYFTVLISSKKTDCNKSYVLHELMRNGDLPRQVKKIKALLKRPDLKVNAKDLYDETALHVAVNNENLYGVKQLLKHPDINKNIKDIDNQTPQMLANSSIEILFH